jgi:O-antigen/teichoic acid export membrane protein
MLATVGLDVYNPRAVASAAIGGSQYLEWGNTTTLKFGGPVKALARSVGARAVTVTAGASAVASGLGSVGGFLIAAALGPAGRGYFAAIFSWPSLIGTIAGFGVPQATCYWVASDRKNATCYVATSAYLLLLISLVIGLGGFALAPTIGRTATVVGGLRTLFLCMPLFIIPGAWLGALQATNVVTWNLARMFQPISYLAIVSFLFVSHRLSVSTAVFAVVISLVLQAMASGVLAWRTVGACFKPDPSVVRPLIRFGSRSAAVYGPSLLNGRLDQLILSLLVSARELGRYSLAVSLSTVAAPISSAFGDVAFPRIASRGKSDASRLRKLALLGSLGVSLVFLVPLVVAAPWFVPRVFGPGFQGSVLPLYLLAPAAALLMFNKVAEDIIRGYGDPLPAAIAEILGAIATGGLLFLLIPKFGINGAALASLLSYALVTALLLRALKGKGRGLSGPDEQTS